jgi:excisionase family DNA binding protein
MSITEDRKLPLLCPLDESQAQLGGIGRTTLYDLIATGQLKPVKIGRRTFIPQTELDAYVKRISEGE